MIEKLNERLGKELKDFPIDFKVLMWCIVHLTERGRKSIPIDDLFSFYRCACKNMGFKPLDKKKVNELVLEMDLAGFIKEKFGKIKFKTLIP